MKTQKDDERLMLLTDWNPSIDLTGWMMSEKYNGWRATLQPFVGLTSRTGRHIEAPEWWLEKAMDGLRDNAILDGELWAGRGTLHTLNQIIQKTIRLKHQSEFVAENPEWNQIKFMAFARIDEVGLSEICNRQAAIADSYGQIGWPLNQKIVQPVYHFKCTSNVHAINTAIGIIQDDGEGIVAYNPAECYTPGRSVNAVRIKKSILKQYDLI